MFSTFKFVYHSSDITTLACDIGYHRSKTIEAVYPMRKNYLTWLNVEY